MDGHYIKQETFGQVKWMDYVRNPYQYAKLAANYISSRPRDGPEKSTENGRDKRMKEDCKIQGK